MRKLRIPFTGGIDKLAKTKKAQAAILMVAEKIIDNTKNPDALANMRGDICNSIVQGVQKETGNKETKPTVDEAIEGLLEEERLMRICSKLGISKEEIRSLVEEGLQ